MPIRIGVKNIMTRSQLITKVANDTNMTAAEVEKVMDGIFGTIGDVLKSGDKVTSKLEPTAIPGFKASGRFKQKLEAGKKSVEETA